MIIKGSSRGYAGQLGDYLMTKGKNEEVRVFAIHGTMNTTDVRAASIEMGRFEEITKSRKGVYHAIIRPSHKESFEMTDDQWHHSILSLQKNLGFENLPYLGVMHRDDDGWHMHAEYQKYDPALKKMRPDGHNYRKHDKTREQLEVEFGHPRTPLKNADRPMLRENVTKAWLKANGQGQQFVDNCKEYGYTVASSNFHKWVVISEKGRSYELIKKLENKKEKFSVRHKVMEKALASVSLPLDKEVIKSIRNREKIAEAFENKELFEDIKAAALEKERRKREFVKKFKPRDPHKDHER